MPKKDQDFSKTIIYKLIHKDDNDNKNIYIGHTTNFTQRKNGHKTTCNNPNDQSYHLKQYVFIRENGGWDMWDIIEIEKYPCNDANEASAREDYWASFYKANLNTNVPGRTQKNIQKIIIKKFSEINKKWRQDNHEVLFLKKKEHYDNNVNKILEYRKERVICECGSEVRKSDISRHKKLKNIQIY